MSQIKFLRKGATIRTLNEDGSHSDKTFFDPMNILYPSINAAKRESRKLQAEHGAGTLRVVSKFPQD